MHDRFVLVEETTEKLEAMQPEDTGLGFMEYFDWLASTNDTELEELAKEHRIITVDRHRCFSARERESLGRAIWQKM